MKGVLHVLEDELSLEIDWNVMEHWFWLWWRVA